MKSQRQRVENRLKERGYITRNECLRNYISRLSAIIQDLEADGYVFATYRAEDRDYGYKVVEFPKKRVLVGEVVGGVYRASYQLK